jgi:putative flippase GtrA
MSVVRQGVNYGVVGLIQLVFDWLVFVGLTQLGLPPAPANVSSRVIAAFVGFWLNGRWTFQTPEKRALTTGHFGRYLVSWGVMTLASTTIVTMAAHADGMHTAWIIKPAADLCLAAVGFMVSKYWIYR